MEKISSEREQNKFSGNLKSEIARKEKFDKALKVFLMSFETDNKFSPKEEIRKEQQLGLTALHEALLALYEISEYSDYLGDDEMTSVNEKISALRRAAKFWNGKPQVNPNLDLENIVEIMKNKLQKKQKRVLH